MCEGLKVKADFLVRRSYVGGELRVPASDPSWGRSPSPAAHTHAHNGELLNLLEPQLSNLQNGNQKWQWLLLFFFFFLITCYEAKIVLGAGGLIQR